MHPLAIAFTSTYVSTLRRTFERPTDVALIIQQLPLRHIVSISARWSISPAHLAMAKLYIETRKNNTWRCWPGYAAEQSCYRCVGRCHSSSTRIITKGRIERTTNHRGGVHPAFVALRRAATRSSAAMHAMVRGMHMLCVHTYVLTDTLCHGPHIPTYCSSNVSRTTRGSALVALGTFVVRRDGIRK